MANVCIVVPGLMSMTATFIVIMKYLLSKELRNVHPLEYTSLSLCR